MKSIKTACEKAKGRNLGESMTGIEARGATYVLNSPQSGTGNGQWFLLIGTKIMN